MTNPPTAYYNEIDPYAATWLRNLIDQGHVAPGVVDERSIEDLRPEDLDGFTQCHFFAGIGGWSLALRLAGWPDDRPVWTGSCPCQPFSAAGKGRGVADERHLWPAFHHLIRECRPGVVFGEQVAQAAGYKWWDLVAADLEGEAYAAAAVDIGAHSVGAPHRRQRLYWVAHADGRHASAEGLQRGGQHGLQPEDGGTRILAHGEGGGRRQECEDAAWRIARDGAPQWRGAGPADNGYAGLLGNTDHPRLEGWRDDAGEHAGQLALGAASPWSDLEWLACSDGKARPTQPGLFPLAHGIPNRVGRLRAYGNAIVPQVAAAFIRSMM